MNRMPPAAPTLGGSSLGIAGLGFEVKGAVGAWSGPKTFRPPNLVPAVRLAAWSAPPPTSDLGRLLFDPGSFWTARAHPQGFAFAIGSPAGLRCLDRLAVMNPTWTAGEIYVHPDLPAPRHTIRAVAWPLDTLLAASLLPHRNGLLFHGAGLVVDGFGYLFAGPSGAGKSTLVKLLRDVQLVTILNDERCVVRREGDLWRLYGTPWHGEVNRVAYGGVPLRKVFLLAQAPAHRAVPLGVAEAARQLFGRCLWPFWDTAGMEGGLATLEALCREIPCLTLNFRPDAEVLRCIVE